jgi:hypothetical protein
LTTASIPTDPIRRDLAIMATKTVQAAEAVTEAVTQAVVKGPMFKKNLGNKQIFLFVSPIAL